MAHGRDSSVEKCKVRVPNRAFSELGFGGNEVTGGNNRMAVHFTTTERQVRKFIGMPSTVGPVNSSNTETSASRTAPSRRPGALWSGVSVT